MHMAPMDLGKRIKELRERQKLTQQQLADAATLSRVYVQKLEAGERESPSWDALERVAKALGATLRIDLVVKRGRPSKGGRHGR
jgi:transcriptional regulator with XRE-family HTH domain